jgi:leucyl aminopeptidase (aminopeptidase T)
LHDSIFIPSRREPAMGSIQFGAMQAVRNCVRLSPWEKVVIITDRETREIADALVDEAKKISADYIKVFIMEDFGERPEDGSNPLPLPREIAEALATAEVSFYAAAGKKGELKSFRIPMLEAVEANKKLRHAHMPGVNRLLMETGMSVDYSVVQRLSSLLVERCRKARSITVTTKAGTDFTVMLNPEWKWKVSDGLIKAEDWSNLPDGEIFTCAWKIPSGIVVVDGILGDFFSQKYGLLEENSVTLTIKDGRVTDVNCAREDLLEELKENMRQDENADRIGEFAIGTNVGLDRLVGNLLQDEKFPGVHIAIGHGYPEKTGSDWGSAAHVDAVLKKTTIRVDEEVVMEDGTFTIPY